MADAWNELDDLAMYPSEEGVSSGQALPTDFWERHFLLCDLAQQAEEMGAQFTFQVRNQLTGETQRFDGVHLSTKGLTIRH